MKNKLKFIITSIIACFFLTTVTACNNDSKYLDGDVCGEATADGTNSFSQIRRYYCEQFVYESNKSLIAEGEDYAAYADVYDDKFIYDEENKELDLIEPESGDYTKAHYIFVYYGIEEQVAAVKSYVTNNVTEPEKYLDLVQLCAKGHVDGDETTTGIKYGYFPKINNTSYDNDTFTYDVTKDGTKTSVTVNSVATRMTTHQKACLVFTDNFVDPETGIVINKTTWGEAWDVGLLYGLFVYPLGWLINSFVVMLGSTGWAQIGAILIVTVILKLLILLLTFKSQTSTQKMQDIQPEILKIQSKYGPTPTPEEKQRMSMELMNVYQKYGVKPFAPFASLLITFPVFIAMYRAVMFLGILRTGNIGGVILGVNLSEYIIGGRAFNYVALIIFLLMAASQILSMKLPQILNSKRMSKEAKQQQKQTSMMTNMMMIMILVMGFMMPATMSIYWVASAVVGMIQSIIMHKVNNGSKNGRYKVKTAEREVAKIPQGYKK